MPIIYAICSNQVIDQLKEDNCNFEEFKDELTRKVKDEKFIQELKDKASLSLEIASHHLKFLILMINLKIKYIF